MKSPSRPLQFLALALALAVGTSCGSDGATPSPTPAAIGIVVQPTGAVSGYPLTTQPVVRIEDADGNLITGGDPVTVQVSLAPATGGSGTIRGTRSVASVNGIVTFTDIRIDGHGSFTLGFTAPTLDEVDAPAFLAVQTVDSLALKTAPAGAVRGYPFTTPPVVKLIDHAGLLVTTATDTVRAVVAGGGAKLIGSTKVAAVAGLATFTDLGVDSASSAQISFLVTGVDTVTTASLAVAPPPPVALKVTTQPAGAVSGLTLTTQPVIHLNDHDSSLATAASGVQVTASLASGTGTLVGTKTVASVAGVATFTDLRIDGAGSHTLQFAATSLAGAQASPVSVVQVKASLALQVAPAGGTMGLPFTTQPVIAIHDNAGLLIASATDSISAQIVDSGALIGTTKVAAVGGLATFTDLGVNNTDTARIDFVLTGVDTVATSPLAIGPAQVTSVVIAPTDTDLVVGHVGYLKATLRDANNFLVSGPKPKWRSSDTTVARVNGNGNVTAWGAGTAQITASFQLGADTIPVTVTDPTGAQFTALAVGGNHTCALRSGAAYCWGANDSRQLGDGSASDRNIPTLVPSGAISFTSLALGTEHSCALDGAGAAYCWGSNHNNRLGRGGPSSPVAGEIYLVAGGHTFTQLAAGEEHTCGLGTDSLAWCWGGNEHGQVGDSTLVDRNAPTAVYGGVKFTALYASNLATCGSVADGTLYCWGGVPAGVSSYSTFRIPEVMVGGTHFAAVTMGRNHACALDGTGAAYCWGSDQFGQMGDPAHVGGANLTATLVFGGHLYTAIAAGDQMTCALATTGETYCWGTGTLGNGQLTPSVAPVVVRGGHSFTNLAVGTNHACAREGTGESYCWGSGRSGQLGDAMVSDGHPDVVFFPSAVLEP